MTILTDSHAATATPTGTMRAAVVTAPDRPLDVRDVPIPAPGPGQALVKVLTTGVCHTDLHAARGDWPVAPKSDLIPGHEGYGRVVALGDGVTSLAVGDLVGNAWLWSACGVCEFCRTGWETLCPDQQNGGYSVDGSFGEYMLVDERFAARIPEGADPVEVAPILCAGVTVYKGLKMTEARPGEWVVISGIGGLGHIAVQYARAMGLRVAAVDIDDAKLELARQHGAELTVNALTQDPAAVVQERTGGAHGVLVTAVHPKASARPSASPVAARPSCSTASRRETSPPTSSTSCSARSRSADPSSARGRT